jgi:hypothetical protein
MVEAVNAYAETSNKEAAARKLGLHPNTYRNRLLRAQEAGISPESSVMASDTPSIAGSVKDFLMRHKAALSEIEKACRATTGEVLDAIDELKRAGVNVQREGDRYVVAKTFAQAYTENVIEIVSRKDNTFLFGACGDQHIGSKYHREDVNHDLYRRYADAGVQAAFNTGNWIDGEASFNRYDILAHGIDAQAKLMADLYPKHSFPTYAVWGDDHEGWYVQREGIDVGRYVESIMREAGHNWHDLGFMEAHVRLVNANSGKSVVMSVVHPGGGSSYATSYRPQKIIESFEGGEKPAVLLLGHYHKLDAGLVRNVWYLQTGTTEDQTPFMRKKSLEAHVGGAMIHLEQDPESGAITGFTPNLWRYFNRAFHVQAGLANGRWSKHEAVRRIPRGIQP